MVENTEYIIRKANINDVRDLSNIYIEFINKQSDIKAMEKKIDIISKNTDYFVAVACSREKVIGTAMGIICYDLVGSCDQFLLIENVAILPEYRGQGIGKLLIDVQEEFARKNKCKYAILVSGSKRTKAHKFYESIGYSKEYGFKKKF